MSSPAADDLTITAGQWVGARTIGGTLKLSTDTVEFVPHAFDRTFGRGNPLRARAGDVDEVLAWAEARGLAWRRLGT